MQELRFSAHHSNEAWVLAAIVAGCKRLTSVFAEHDTAAKATKPNAMYVAFLAFDFPFDEPILSSMGLRELHRETAIDA